MRDPTSPGRGVSQSTGPLPVIVVTDMESVWFGSRRQLGSYVATLLTTYLPARAACRVAPAEALRFE
jgi:hypothetical protein